MTGIENGAIVDGIGETVTTWSESAQWIAIAD
jgi:hypothetical protein